MQSQGARRPQAVSLLSRCLSCGSLALLSVVVLLALVSLCACVHEYQRSATLVVRLQGLLAHALLACVLCHLLRLCLHGSASPLSLCLHCITFLSPCQVLCAKYFVHVCVAVLCSCPLCGCACPRVTDTCWRLSVWVLCCRCGYREGAACA